MMFGRQYRWLEPHAKMAAGIIGAIVVIHSLELRLLLLFFAIILIRRLVLLLIR